MITVLIVDDHELVRIGLKRLLSDIPDIQVIGEAETGEQAVQKVKEQQPTVVLMDINMPGIGGLEATKRIIQGGSDSKILAVTVYGDEPFPSRVLQAGALGYITKGAHLDEMLVAIRQLSRGKRYISPEIAQQLALKQLNQVPDSPFDTLSERELQVVIMITSGQKVPEIASQLFLSSKTINSYRYRIFEKLNINSDVELTHLALRYKLIENQIEG